ncbi:MAG: ATP synthase F1 subunit gamma [Myxococcota bacterium]
MPTLRDIKRRITTVEKTQQITRAMRMVAAAKLRRAQDAIESARPYAGRMRETLREIVATQSGAGHPLLEAREKIRRLELVVISSDRGLAGAFNGNVIKRAEAILAEREAALASISLTLIGRRVRDHFRRRRSGQIRQSHEIGGWVEYERVAEIAKGLAREFEGGEVDQVVLVFNEFVSILTQLPTSLQLLPFEAAAQTGEPAHSPHSIEPGPEELLAALVPKAIEVEVFRAMLENQAGEHAARMTAMESATRNTEELIKTLTLEYNRARQAAITKELVEIVTGAQALE